MKQYDFNEKGFCNNPTGETLWQDGKTTVIIAYCQRYGRWVYGYHMILENIRQYSMPQIIAADSGYSSQKEAKNAIISEVIGHLEKYTRHGLPSVIEKLKSDISNA
ncbi:hypothetical protein [Pedobacter zeae]|uniref:Uncharacterized protein n=1 Tax=Pedobacter zeae TaxID=1737356 RepID=A0A7W6P586_9SPHI|nr:hypothetical protein [Pedobacter zeae]MBB4106644.1 hypothetical protein [Pedobacter zeae]GGH02904.1 hypothetical protein GCM10007422_17620 [Pedobacter zeae]